MDMQDVCATMLDEIDGALCCIVIDMQTGLTVAAEYRPGSVVDAAAINLVSVISTDMFRGKMIRQFESVLERPESGLPGFVREVQMTSATINQFMAAIPDWDDGVFVLVTDKSVSLGLGWMAVHRMIGRIGVSEAWTAPNQPHHDPASAQQPAPIPSDGAAARRIEPGVRFPAEHASPANAHADSGDGSVRPVADGHAEAAPAEPKPRVVQGPRAKFVGRKSRRTK